MTGPNPDADLDQALGLTELPPVAVTEDHRSRALAALRNSYAQRYLGEVAQAIADAEQRGAARVLAEHAAADALTTADETLPSNQDNKTP
jgi:hypothetical protein